MACTMMTSVPCSDLLKYKNYLQRMGFKDFDLFSGKNGEDTLYVLFTNRYESDTYVRSKVETRYLIVGD